MKELITIQSELKAPKNQFNSFGKYKYRNQEDILEAVKPLLLANSCVLTLTDDVIELGDKQAIKSTATITNSKNEVFQSTAIAGVEWNRKGMDVAQSFGASCSYARKYALGGLFLLDDSKEVDQPAPAKKVKPSEELNSKQLEASIKKATTIDELSAMYRNNIQNFTDDSFLVEMLTKRKNEIKAKANG